MLTRQRAARRSDEGFTLIELLMSITILGIIGGAIASSFFVLLSTQKRTEKQLSVSQDRQLVATYFPDDVAGATSVTTGNQSVCGTSMNTVVTLRGTDYNPGSTTPVPTTVAYTFDSPSARLVRTACRAGGARQDATVARNVLSAPGVAGDCTASGPLAGTPSVLRINVPQIDGEPVVVCAVRRPQ